MTHYTITRLAMRDICRDIEDAKKHTTISKHNYNKITEGVCNICDNINKILFLRFEVLYTCVHKDPSNNELEDMVKIHSLEKKYLKIEYETLKNLNRLSHHRCENYYGAPICCNTFKNLTTTIKSSQEEMKSMKKNINTMIKTLSLKLFDQYVNDPGRNF